MLDTRAELELCRALLFIEREANKQMREALNRQMLVQRDLRIYYATQLQRPLRYFVKRLWRDCFV